MTNRYAVQFEKEKGFLKAYLVGRGFFSALRALGMVERLTAGKFRKDGVTPELHHQVRVALSATQLKILETEKIAGLNFEEMLIICCLLHDSMEDQSVSKEELVAKFNVETYEAVWAATKKFGGVIKNKEDFIQNVSLNLVTALTKGLDRMDNIEHMIGTFTLEKIISYNDEARSVFLPMLKRASKLFPEHYTAFQQIMQAMKRQVKMNDHYTTAAKEIEALKNAAQTENVDSNVDSNVESLNAEIQSLKITARQQAMALQWYIDKVNQLEAEAKPHPI